MRRTDQHGGEESSVRPHRGPVDHDAKRVLRTEGTLDRVQGNARLAEAPLAEEVAAALDATDKDVEIGGAGLAAGAIELGLVDELHIFRNPVLVGGGTPLLPPVTKHVPLDLIETSKPSLSQSPELNTVPRSVGGFRVDRWPAVVPA
jgi:dihydrofolate reductase